MPKRHVTQGKPYRNVLWAVVGGAGAGTEEDEVAHVGEYFAADGGVGSATAMSGYSVR
jgi:hypothetical protein